MRRSRHISEKELDSSINYTYANKLKELDQEKDPEYYERMNSIAKEIKVYLSEDKDACFEFDVTTDKDLMKKLMFVFGLL